MALELMLQFIYPLTKPLGKDMNIFLIAKFLYAAPAAATSRQQQKKLGITTSPALSDDPTYLESSISGDVDL